MKMNRKILVLITILSISISFGQKKKHEKGHRDTNKFRQFKSEWATPNDQRTASGAPGHNYKQQKVDYVMDIRLDEENDKLYGEEKIIYHNNSNDHLEYLWLQLDQNVRAPNSKTNLIKSQSSTSWNRKYALLDAKKKDFGFKIETVTHKGKPLSHTINATMMRINLPKPLAPNRKFVFSIKWNYLINNSVRDSGRSGFEDFPDGNHSYALAQFFPRLCVYNNVEGWQNMQFWGRSEFALEFGDYEVNLTVPADHIVEATGKLKNRKEVLTEKQLERYEKAEESFDKPVLIVTEEEAIENSKEKSKETKTWKYKAKNVRDFAFATSRKYIWDAMAVDINGKKVMAVSLYPKEGNPLWEEHSTKVVANTLEEYSKMTFDYPYPKAVSVHARHQGMEYPMICFNYGRPEEDGTYSDRTKYGMIGVITHEVGHNFFPMIVNSDERQWTWMDEGLNSFVEMLAEFDYDKKHPVRALPKKVVRYMSLDQKNLSPIMSQGDYVKNFGPNAYSKPAAGLWMLRHTIMGPELFDYAFRTYAKRWAFKHPTPEDFFRTMEDASGMDLDWFWRGWFYTTDYNDMSIKKVTEKIVNQEEMKRFVQTYPKEVQDIMEEVPKYAYRVEFEKLGGLVLPLLVELTFEDGTKQMHHYPAELWRKNDKTVFKVYKTAKRVKSIVIDPKEETADIDVTNNSWPKQTENKFDKFKKKNQ